MEKMIILKNNGAMNQEKQFVGDAYKTQTKLDTSDYMVAFSGLTKSYCVGIVDMVNSTKISAGMNELEWCKYYEIFLNSMAKILPRFGGRVIKNQGDSLLYYFPESSSGTKFGFVGSIESSLSLIEEHDLICENLNKIGLPNLNYRVSIDYGKVVIMNSNNSSTPDLIGPPVNMCSKINHLAPSNGIAIGGDLYQNIRGIKDYQFSQTKGFSIGFKYSYPVYNVTRL
jgi:class 3 adenylate cyclase